LLGWLQGLGNFFSINPLDQLGGPTRLIFKEYQKLPRMAAHLYLVPKSRMKGVVSPCLYMLSWRARVQLYPLPFYLELNSVRESGSARLNQKQEIFVCNLTRLFHSAS
jgi:hypothetical protein